MIFQSSRNGDFHSFMHNALLWWFALKERFQGRPNPVKPVDRRNYSFQPPLPPGGLLSQHRAASPSDCMSCGKQDIGVRRTHLHWIGIQYGEMQSSHWLLVILLGLNSYRFFPGRKLQWGYFVSTIIKCFQQTDTLLGQLEDPLNYKGLVRVAINTATSIKN